MLGDVLGDVLGVMGELLQEVCQFGDFPEFRKGATGWVKDGHYGALMSIVMGVEGSFCLQTIELQ